MDDLVVVVDELGEAEDVTVEVDIAVHVAELDVADAVVDLEKRKTGRRPCRLLYQAEARSEWTVVVAPVDERVDDLSVGVDGAATEGAVLVRAGLGVLQIGARASAGRLSPRRSDVVDSEGDVMDPIAVAMDVFRDLAVG